MIVRITKIGTVEDGVPAAVWGDPDAIGKSLPVDYEVEGRFLAPISLGTSLQVLRFRRNGIEMLGLFSSSVVTTLYAVTRNSVYRIEPAGADGIEEFHPEQS